MLIPQTRWSFRIILMVAALVTVFTVVLFTRSGSGKKQYVSDVFVLMKPFTNAVLATRFEKAIKRAVPEVARLYFQESSFVQRSLGKTTTNTQVVIQIAANAEGITRAIEKANRAAPLVCTELKKIFPAASISVLNSAVGARQVSPGEGWLSLRFGKRNSVEPTPVSGTVSFVDTGILLTPGDEWHQHYGAGMRCPPSLLGIRSCKGQFLVAHLLSQSHEDFEVAIAARSEKVKAGRFETVDSLQIDKFTSKSGLFVARLSYYQNSSMTGPLIRSKHADYITTNRAGSYVLVTHLNAGADQSDAVHRMILDSLRLQ